MSIVGFIAATALAIVSIVVSLEDKPALEARHSALALIEKIGPEADPVYVTNAAAEELVWWHEGRFKLKAPWLDAPNEASYTAIAHDPAGLPQVGGSGLLAVVAPWAAKRYGDASGASDLMARLKEARIEVISASGDSRICKSWKAGKWHCGPNAWNYVGPQSLVILGRKTTCLWLHPMERSTLKVTFPGIGAGRLVKGRIALSDEAARTAGGAPVEFEVMSGDKEIFSRTHANKPGWSRFEVRPTSDEGVSFTVSAASTGRRHFCMQASVEPEEAAP